MAGIMGSLSNGMQPEQEEPGETPHDEQSEQGEPGERGEQGGAGDPDDNPAYAAAMEVVMQALYKKGGAKDVAKAMRSGNPAQALADTSYQIVQVADERTNGEVPDELLAPLAVDVITEVAEVAEAAGVTIDGDTVSKAMQLMVVRFLKDQGVDPSQIQQQMANLDQQANVGQVLDKAAQQKE